MIRSNLKLIEDVKSRVYVVDDNSEMRRSLHCLLDTIDIAAWPFSNAADFLDEVDGLPPAPVLLDIRMSGMDGFGVLAELASRGINFPVIVITAHGDVPTAVRAMRLGAVDFLEKPFQLSELEYALGIAFAAIVEHSRAVVEQSAARTRFNRLTPREFEVVDALMRGLSNKLIANRLILSARTIEMYRAHALIKLGVKSVPEMMALAALAGMGTMPELAA